MTTPARVRQARRVKRKRLASCPLTVRLRYPFAPAAFYLDMPVAKLIL
jgi:hypothetical protein